jgi:hypothetical protein
MDSTTSTSSDSNPLLQTFSRQGRPQSTPRSCRLQSSNLNIVVLVAFTYPCASGLLSAGTFFVVSVVGTLVCFWRFAAPFDASAGMYGRRMRGFGGTAAMGGLGGFAGVGGGPGVAERLRMLERDRPARFGERTRANWERDREFEREIAREAAIKQEEESAASTVRHTFLNVGLG